MLKQEIYFCGEFLWLLIALQYSNNGSNLFWKQCKGC